MLNGTTNLCKSVMENPALSLCGTYSSIIGPYFTIYYILWHLCVDDPSTILSSALQTSLESGPIALEGSLITFEIKVGAGWVCVYRE